MKMKLAAKNPNNETFFFADGKSMDKFYETHSEEQYPFIGMQPYTKGQLVFDATDEREREFYRLLEIFGIGREEAKTFIRTEETEKLDAEFKAEVDELVKKGIIHRVTPEDMQKTDGEEEPWSVCPRCGDKDRGEATVMNGVDDVIQVPSFLQRLGIEKHSHIVCCNECECCYEVETSMILTDNEKEELNKLWEAVEDKC